MLEVITYVGLPVLVTLIGGYVYVEAEKRKAIEKKKKAVILLVAQIKDSFKADIKRFVEQESLTIKQYESVYRIANNFFIFQPVSGQSIEFCKHTLNNVISAMPNGGPDTIHFDLLQAQISLFVSSLPTTANGYNGIFYRKELPRLIKELVDAKEAIFKIESELSNEGLTLPDSPEAA